MQIALVDRWFNPTDPVVASFAQFIFRLGGDGQVADAVAVPLDRWFDLEIVWHGGSDGAAISIDGSPSQPLVPQFPTVHGISYLHLQSMAEGHDPVGVLLERVEMQSESLP